MSGVSQVALVVKNQPANAEDFLSLDKSLIPGQEDPWRRGWETTPVFLLGESHGQRTLVG